MRTCGKIIAFAASLLFALCACNPEEPFEKEDVISPEIEGTESGGLVKMEFEGTFSDDDVSRTYLSGSHVLWKGSDKLCVIDSQSPYIHQFDNTDSEGGSICRFIGEAKAGESTWAVGYPCSAFARRASNSNTAWVTIPKVQTAVLGGFPDNSYITYCRTNSKNFTMKPLVSLVKFTIRYDNIVSVRLDGNSSSDFSGNVRPFAGKFYFYTNIATDDVILHYDGSDNDNSSITLNKPDGEDTFPPGDYFVPVVPMGDSDATNNFPSLKNMRLVFTRSDGQTASRSKTGLTDLTGIVFPRGKYTDLGVVDEGLSWGYYDIEFATAGDSYSGTEYLIWPFASWKTSNDAGESWTEKADPSANMSSLRSNIAWDIEGKLKDSGHPLRCHAEEEGGTGSATEQLRYANNANGFYLNGHVGSYIEFPAMPNRYLMRVEVQYDSTSKSGGNPYMKDHSASACPHITTTDGDDIDYSMSRDGNGFHHNYNLYGTDVNTAYQYRIAYDLGTNWSGPRIQRIRLYYSKETRSLTLPTPTLTCISTTLRQHQNTLTLTGADGTYDIGIVVRNALETADDSAPEGHEYDRVITVSAAPEVAGNTQTYVWTNSLPWSTSRFTDDLGLTEENEVYAYVRKFGCDTDPRDMDPASSALDGSWRTGTLTRIQRPSYDWNGTSSDLNYVYASDDVVKLSATFTVTAGATQAYDYGFIYKAASDPDVPANWNYTKLDQNGTEKANISGYTLESGDSQDISATLTGLTPGTVYVYRPVAVQHLACKFGENQSGETPQYMYIPRESSGAEVTLAGPVVTVTSSNPSGSYVSATTGSILNSAYLTVSHLDPDLAGAGARFSTGWAYGGTPAYLRTRYDTKTIGTGSFSNGVWSNVIAYNTNSVFEGGSSFRSPVYLSSLADSDGATVQYRPYFAFVSGDGDGTEGRHYTPDSNYGTITCPVVSTPTSGDYLWRTATTADLKGTIAIGDSNCKMEIGYSTDGGANWTVATQNLAAGAKTIGSAAGITEGGQTVLFGARRSGSADDDTWKTLSITLGQPITSVYTYGSSYWNFVSTQSVTVAGSYTVNKVASNACVVYGVQYYVDTDKNWSRSTETLRMKTVNGSGTSIPAYVQVDLTTGVTASSSRGNPLIYWFFARLKGSSSTPDDVGAVRSGSSLSSTLGSSTFGSDDGTYGKRVMINFNTFYENSGTGGYVNPFLPASGYVQSLPNSISSTLVRSGSAMLAGGLTLGFSLTSGKDTWYDQDTPISGLLYESNSTSRGALRVYSNSVDDFIESPAITDRRVQRFLSYTCYTKTGNNYFGPVIPATVDARVFCSSNDRNLLAPTTGWNSASPSALVQNTFGNRDVSASFSTYTSTYNNTGVHIHFCSGGVTNGKYPTADKKCSPWETRMMYMAFDYSKTGSE